MKRILKLLFLPILSIALFAYTYTNQIQPKLGLDLQGGISVILTAEEGTDKELIEQAHIKTKLFKSYCTLSIELRVYRV